LLGTNAADSGGIHSAEKNRTLFAVLGTTINQLAKVVFIVRRKTKQNFDSSAGN
jgi:hypothetical protein